MKRLDPQPLRRVLRNLDDVFGENDAKRRSAAIDEIFTEDCVFYEPGGNVRRGRDAIERIAGSGGSP